MKRLTKCLFALLLIALMLVSATAVVYAADGEYEPEDIYVLNYGVPDDEYTGPNMQYFSAYLPFYNYDEGSTYDPIYLYSMYNTVTGDVIPTYCTDIKTAASTNNRYRRLNLEDSTYAADTAELIRAIMLSGFYIVPIDGETEEEHRVRVDAKLAEIGAAVGVPDLTIGEAIAGTQTAIWEAAHGTRLEFTDFVFSIHSTTLRSQIKYYDICDEERKNGHIERMEGQSTKPTPECDEYLNTRIKAVYDYLISLEPVPPTTKVVSPLSFVDFNTPVRTLNDDGTYDITVTTTVDVDMTEDDYLTLSAVLDSTHYKSAPLVDGNQEVTLTIENVPADIAAGEVTLAIDGMQTVDDVVLYEAKGGRVQSQSMIGMDNSQLPVHASIPAIDERIIHFYKTALTGDGANSSRHPLEGIIFDIFLAAELDDYFSGEVVLPDAKDYKYPNKADYIAITDENGRATVNFTKSGLPDGVYLVVERKHPAIKEPIDPFYVFIPTTNAEGTGYDYEILIQPKNEVKGDIRVDKDINSIGNNKDSVDAYENHTWIISVNVPEDIGMGKSFVITDTLDNRLDYIGNVKVNLETTDGESVITTLEADVDYEVTVNDVDSLAEGKPSDSLKIELTKVGMSKIATSIGTNAFDGYAIRAYFDSCVNANANLAEEITNQAIIKYVNSVNFEFDARTDEPVVFIGRLNLLKVDPLDKSKVLAGAVFDVYRVATQAEVAANGSDLCYLAGYSAPMVRVSFFDNDEMNGVKVTSVTTDENGKATIYGLAYGEYYLMETKAPDNYNLPGDVIKVVIDGESHTDANVILIENVSGFVLPSTGGIGTTVFTVIGVLMMLASGLVLYIRKRVVR